MQSRCIIMAACYFWLNKNRNWDHGHFNARTLLRFSNSTILQFSVRNPDNANKAWGKPSGGGNAPPRYVLLRDFWPILKISILELARSPQSKKFEILPLNYNGEIPRKSLILSTFSTLRRPPGPKNEDFKNRSKTLKDTYKYYTNPGL